MTLHDDLMSSMAMPVLMDTHGQEVIYTVAAGFSSVITAMVGPETIDAGSTGSDGRQRQTVRTITVSTADVAAPARYDQVTIGGDTWRVEWAESLGGGRAKLRLCLVARHG